MPGAANYSVVEHIRDGRPIDIRALRPDDRAEMLAAIGRTSTTIDSATLFRTKEGLLGAGDGLLPQHRFREPRRARRANR